jgi:hypothetical protein
MVGDDQDACNALHARQPEKQSFAACRSTAALGSLQKFAAETTNVVHWLRTPLENARETLRYPPYCRRFSPLSEL